MFDLADRVGIAAVLLATQALGACAGGAEDPLSLGVDRERLDQGIWTIIDIGDFNRDGMADLLWDDSGKSKMAIWLMAGTDLLAPGAPIPGPPGADWRVAWAADFDGDGMVDARWDNTASQATAIWLMAGTELLLPGPAIPGPLGEGWEHDGSIDFNADGMADLLLRNTMDHTAEVWLMSGTELLLPGPAIPPPLGDDWKADRSGDFNADGMADVLWRNPTTHSISIGLMNGTERLLQGPVRPGPLGDGWSTASLPDFNADGMADVLWYNEATRVIAVWLMAGTELLLAGPEIPAPPGDGWRPVNTGDLNGDGMADVVWENQDTRQFAVWLMAGTEVLLRGAEIPGPGEP
jgi:hypothetical protein